MQEVTNAFTSLAEETKYALDDFEQLKKELGMPKHIKTIPGGYTQQKCFICGKAYTTLYSRKFKDEDGTISKIRLCGECLESATAARDMRQEGNNES